MSVGTAIATALIWYGVIVALALMLYPLVYRITPGLPDRGLSLAGPLGLLFAVLGPWWMAAAGLTPFTTGLLAILPIVLGFLLWGYELWRGNLAGFLRREWPHALLWQAVPLTLFLGYVLFRGFQPAIAHTEKPMDMAFLNSAIHAVTMPPPDPWFAGEPINYYYLGYVLMAALARLSGTDAAVAFNLSLATIFAFATTAAAGIAVNIVRAIACRSKLRIVSAGVLGSVFLVGIGNLVTPLRFLRDPSGTLSAGWWHGVGWQASRVIVDSGIPGTADPRPTINEFPAFSFVLGDLHPHVLAYPLFLAAIGLAVGLFLPDKQASSRREQLGRLLPAVGAGILVGALYAMNAWDMPTTLVVTGGAILLGGASYQRRFALMQAGALVVAALVTTLPFAMRFTPSVGAKPESLPEAIARLPLVGRLARTIGIVVWSRSSLASLLEVYGLFLLVLLLLLIALWPLVPRTKRPAIQIQLLTIVVAVAVAIVAGFPAVVLFGVPFVALVWIATHARLRPALRFLAWLGAATCGLILIPEVLFLQDAFGDRMNTVFKVYFQAWALLSVTSAAVLPIVLPRIRRRHGLPLADLCAAVVGVFLIGAALYPPLSAYRWTDGFAQWQGLDGLAYIRQASPAEADALTWLGARVAPGDVVLEAPGCSYGETGGIPHNRVSMATGMATPIGWYFHEYQWRNGIPAHLAALGERQTVVNTIYQNPTSSEARQLLDQFAVRYIYVGEHERAGYGSSCQAGPPYPSQSLAAFDQLGWPRVFEAGQVIIYERPAGEGMGN